MAEGPKSGTPKLTKARTDCINFDSRASKERAKRFLKLTLAFPVTVPFDDLFVDVGS